MNEMQLEAITEQRERIVEYTNDHRDDDRVQELDEDYFCPCGEPVTDDGYCTWLDCPETRTA